MPYFAIHRPDWNATGAVMLMLLLVEVGVAAAAAGGALPIAGPALFVLATGVAIGSIVIALRCRMPRWAKIGGSVLLSAALLLVTATQDVLGVGAVDHRVAIALEVNDSPPVPVTTTGTVEIAINPAEGVADNGFATALAREFALAPPATNGNIEIIGSTEYKRERDRDTYGLTWSVRRGSEFAWCGKTSVMTRERAEAVSISREILGHAIEASIGGKIRCHELPKSSG